MIGDDIIHPGWLCVRDGTGRFLTETSSPINDPEPEEEVNRMSNRTSLVLSQRIVEAKRMKSTETTALVSSIFQQAVPHHGQQLFPVHRTTRCYGLFRQRNMSPRNLEYHSFLLALENVPVWTHNPQLSAAKMSNIF